MHSVRRNDKLSAEKAFLDLATTDLVQFPVLFRVSFIPCESRRVRKLIGKPRHALYITSIYRKGNLPRSSGGLLHRWTGGHRTTGGCGESTWNLAVSESVRRRSRPSSRRRTPPTPPSSPRRVDHAAGASDRDRDGDGGADVGSKIGSRVPRRTRTTLPTARRHGRSRSMVVPCGLPLAELGEQHDRVAYQRPPHLPNWPFSGERRTDAQAYHNREEPQAEPRRRGRAHLQAGRSGRSSAATALWVDRSILDSPGQLGMIGAGHAPAGYESATASA